MENVIEEAWGIIANAHGGDWSKASPEWRQAAERWRDEHVTRRAAGAVEVVRKVSDMVKNHEEPPLPLSVITNYMGINLCSVDAMSWVQQTDGQLVSLTIHFIPAPAIEPSAT